MKKRLAAILAALMVLSMGTTAVWANSPDTSTDAGLIEEYLSFNSSSFPEYYTADTVVCVGSIKAPAVNVNPEDEEGYWVEMAVGTDTNLVEDVMYFTVYEGSVYELWYQDGVVTIQGMYVDAEGELTLDVYVASSDYSEDMILAPISSEDNTADSNSGTNNSGSADSDSASGNSPKTGDASLALIFALLVGGVGIAAASRRKTF